MEKKLISIIVPLFNEEKNISPLFYRIEKTLQPFSLRYDFEIIFINDGSEDQSDKIIEGLAEKDRRLKYIEFSRNFGKEIATSAGLCHCKGEAAIMIDADLQHPPELLPRFIEKWEAGAEIVTGVREKNDGEGLVKKIGTAVFYKAMDWVGKTKITPHATDFRLLDRKVVAEFNRFTERNRITRGLIDWLGFKREYIFFVADKRAQGDAAYSFSKLFKLGLSTLITHSLFPLRVAGYLGIFITLFSGAVGLFIIVHQFILKDPLKLAFSGSAMLAIFILFLIGIVLVCLGLIALYVANIHNEVINRPMYVIRRKKNI